MTDGIRTAMLMAAGLGTRLRPFTDARTKALLPLLGVPLAQFVVDSLGEVGVDEVVFNVHHRAAEARAGLAGGIDWGAIRARVSDESALLLGSAGGVRRALPLLGSEPFFWANPDRLFDIDWRALARAHARARDRFGAVMTLAVIRRSPPGERYRELRLDESGERVLGAGELGLEVPFYAGAAACEPEAFAGLPDDRPSEFAPDVLRPWAERGRVGAYVVDLPWIDVDSPALWARAHFEVMAQLERGRFPRTWTRRIERAARRVAPQVWASKGTPAGAGLAGPAFLGRSGAVAEAGPRAVIYDAAALAAEGGRASDVITFGGKLARF